MGKCLSLSLHLWHTLQVAEGLVLGGISAYANALYPGIANQAIALTFGILAALLFLYKSKLIAATENFKLGVFFCYFWYSNHICVESNSVFIWCLVYGAFIW